MTLLPVVERELRVGSRDRSTYRVRFLGAFILTLFSIFSLWFVRAAFNERPIPPRDLFLFLTWIEFAFVIGAGFTLTCDAISREKRDATLGLLFLTDLKGYDIVLGKLTVAALRGLSAIVATIPILALPLMLGGTDLAELSRTSLTLLVTLFFSMTIGLLASAALRRAWTAFGLSAFVLLVFCLGLPLYGEFVRAYFRDGNLAYLIQLPSPSFALMQSFRTAMGLSGFGSSLAIIATAGFLTLIATALITPQVWKDRPPVRRVASLLEWVRGVKYGVGRARDHLRRRLLDRNPILWLCRRERVAAFGLLMVMLFAGMVAGWFASRDWSRTGWQGNVIIPFVSWQICTAIVHGLILVRLAAAAAERFGEDRRSGALELILSTPLSVREVVRGQWMALVRTFAGPTVIVFLMQALTLSLWLNIPYVDNRGPHTAWQAVTEVFRHIFYEPMEPYQWDFHMGALILMGLFPVLILNWIALAWLSAWLSLRTKAAVTAPVSALILLHVPPWLVFGLLAMIIDENQLAPSHNFSEALVYYFLGGAIIISHQLLCIRWSRRRLYQHFRAAATDRYQPFSGRAWWKFWVRLPRARSAAEGTERTQPSCAA
jgi:ABC-type transport system involved in multi-copper enzyme maturation permease subunit